MSNNKKVELVNYFGSDLMCVNAARISFNKTKEILDEKDERLIKFLVEHKHFAPFFHPQLQFRIQCPIYVERQIFKTQIGVSINSLSGRYVDFSDSYTRIKGWRKQSKSSKQGSEGILEENDQKQCAEIENEVINVCAKAYAELIDMGVSKEQARTILPLNLNTTFIWTGSLFAFIRLCELRIKEDAQKETMTLVEEMLEIVRGLEGNPFKFTLASFGY